MNLVSMAKFRNLLVHQYGRVDDSIVYSVLKSDTRDLINYTDQIKSLPRHQRQSAFEQK